MKKYIRVGRHSTHALIPFAGIVFEFHVPFTINVTLGYRVYWIEFGKEFPGG